MTPARLIPATAAGTARGDAISWTAAPGRADERSVNSAPSFIDLSVRQSESVSRCSSALARLVLAPFARMRHRLSTLCAPLLRNFLTHLADE